MKTKKIRYKDYDGSWVYTADIFEKEGRDYSAGKIIKLAESFFRGISLDKIHITLFHEDDAEYQVLCLE